MESIYKYDLFISYATENADIAQYVVKQIENRGKKCFVAPRDIRTGFDYASEIVNGISNSQSVLLVFSSKSDKSAYVLREVNSAVSRNKTIIPLRIENFLPSEAMEFYLGPCHWLDAFPEVLDTHLTKVLAILDCMKGAEISAPKSVRIEGPVILDVAELLETGYDKKAITMREIELDYLSVPTDKYNINDDTEGTLESWLDSVQEYADTACALIKDDVIMGYSEIYPMDAESFDLLASGESMVKEEMIALYGFTGDFDAYIPIIALDPAYVKQDIYIEFIKWMAGKISSWEKAGIRLHRIGITVYNSICEKYAKLLGFRFSALNPARGKVYVSSVEELKENAPLKKLLGK